MNRTTVALVTGAAGGIGAATCRALATRGVCVVATGRRIEAIEQLVDELASEGGEAIGLVLDVAEPASIASAVAEAKRRVGPVHWLVNNAGIAASAPWAKAGPAGLYERLMDVNFHGARRVLEACLPGMVAEGGGRVVQVASSAALMGYAYVAAYAASKHALLGYSRSMALELRPKSVGVCAVCPHYVDTPLTAASVARIVETTGRTADETLAELARQNPGGVLIPPEEVAAEIVGLLAGGRSGAILELIGGATREVDPGFPLQPATA